MCLSKTNNMSLTKTLCLSFIYILGGFMQNTHNKFNNLPSCFSIATQIVIYQQSEKSTFAKGDEKYELLMSALELICTNSHEMPAFSVAENNSTLNALESKTWLELEFDTTQAYNEMPFDSLLIEVDGNFSGFNLIRKHNGKYDGRCFYLNLSSNMTPLSDVINQISKK